MTDASLEFRGTERFSIEARIGHGATGVVYRAHDNERNATVALKLLRRFDPMALYRFKQEFRALADVSHPNLVSLYELVSEGDQWFFTMELVEGTDLLSYVRGEGNFEEPTMTRQTSLADTDKVARIATDETADTLSLPTIPVGTNAPSLTDVTVAFANRRSSPHIAPPATGSEQIDRLRRVLVQLVDGVNALHGAGHLHRDIKPSNVLVTADERVVILDFGVVAELTASGVRSDREGRLVGTPAYMSPEQGVGAAIDEASDWYSVGVILYEALTGRRPFVGAARDIIEAKQRFDPRAPEEVAPDAPFDLAGLCADLMMRDPAQRPSGSEISSRLGARSRASAPQIASRVPAARDDFFGRGAHIEMLRAAYAVACKGEQRTAFVHGTSGVGKSALVTHFLDELRQSTDAVVLVGRCFERESVPYKALDDLIDALSRHLSELPRRDVWDLMPPNVHALALLFPVLRQVEAVLGAARSGLEELHPHELRRRAFDALRELLARLALRAPLVLFLDDVQWGDRDSAELLAHVLRPNGAPAMLLIAAYRREDAPASPFLRALLPAQQSAVSLAIDPLSQHDTVQFALSLLQDESTVARALAKSIAREASGNPFFVEELVRFVMRSQPTGGAISFGSEISFDAVLRARIAELPRDARSLLEIVAVAGRPLSQAVALRAAAVETNEPEVVTALRNGNLVHTRGARDRDDIECFHDRIREAVVSRLSDDELTVRHARLAKTFESSGEGDAETLSIHFEGAGDMERAGRYSLAAADAAAAALAFDRAATLYRRALKLVRVSDAERSELHGKLGDALAVSGRRAEAAKVYREAARTDNASDALEYGRRAAEAYLWSGHVDEGVRALEEVLHIVEVPMPRTSRRALTSFVWRRMWLRLRGLRFKERDASELSKQELSRINALWTASVGFAMCDHSRGADFQVRHLLAALASGERREVARALALEAGYLSVAGRRAHERATAVSKEAHAIAEQVGDPLSLGWAVGARGLVAYQVCDFAATRDLSQRALNYLAGAHGATWERSTIEQYRLWAQYYTGAVDEFSRTVPAMLRAAEDRGDRYTATNLCTGVPNAAWLLVDQPETAKAVQRDALARWTRQGFHLQHYWSFLSTMHAHIYSGEAEEAVRLAQETWPLLRRSRLLRASMVRAESAHARARAYIAAAASRDESNRAALLGNAERDCKLLDKEDAPFTRAWAQLARAGIAAVRGDRNVAVALATRAHEMFEQAGMALYAAAARRQLGVLVGGETGAGHVAAAEEAMGRTLVANPAAYARLLAPGLDVAV